MAKRLEAFEAKLRVLVDVFFSKTFVIATDKGASFYAHLQGMMPVVQLSALEALRENLEAVIAELEESIGEQNGRNKSRRR